MRTAPTLKLAAAAAESTALAELVVCSLEPWDEIWRRNQFFTEELLRRHPSLRVLFVEPPSDVLFDLAQGRHPLNPSLRSLREDQRLLALRPLKVLPRRLGSLTDRFLLRQVLSATRRMGFARPLLWINDLTYTPLICRTGWPALYDITDDWLLAPWPPKEIKRLRSLEAVALEDAREVVVCSPALAASRGKARPVTHVPNGVDVDHFRRPRPRPSDLPPAPTGVYLGTLHDARLDVELVVRLARSLPKLSVVLVGPDSLEVAAHRALASEPNVYLLGPRAYAEVPAYLQHADVLVVPHRTTPFTESLDPIKAYESLAVETPTVATPVAGFRELAGRITVASAKEFPAVVGATLSSARRRSVVARPAGWAERADAFEAALVRAIEGVNQGSGTGGQVAEVVRPDSPGAVPATRVIAFYLPQFHPIAENDEWWGPGFSEWTNAARARPLFRGHVQPHIPADLGFYDLRLPESRNAQAELARFYGVEAFCYWHYWFAGRRILERPYQEMLASGEPDFPFCLAWANQTWSGVWHGAPERVLIEQTYPGPEDDRCHFDHLMPAFTDPRYLRVEGKPFFYVFRPELLPDPQAFVDRWRGLADQAGLPGIYLVAEVSDLLGKGPKYVDFLRHGFDAGVYMRLPARTDRRSTLKMRAQRKLLRHPERYTYATRPVAPPHAIAGDRVHPCVYPNWDNTPRAGRGGLVLASSSPEAFRLHVRAAVGSLQARPREHRLLFVKSWNEWAEGNYLEPDLEHGHGFLRILAEETA